MEFLKKKKEDMVIESKFICNICRKSYSNGSALRNHRVRHLRAEDLPYKCSACEFKTATKLDIARHIQSHSTVALYQCAYCSKQFKRDCNLKEHIKAIHTKDVGYDCQLCNFSTLRRSSLHSHVKSHDESFIDCACPICGSKFKSKAIFKYHLLSHADAKSFCCNLCGKKFTMASRLRQHERHVHGPKNFECNNCHKTFPTVHHLKRHNLIHTGDKPFSCCFCSHSSNTPGNIIKHIKFIHGKIGEPAKYILKKSAVITKREETIDPEYHNYLKSKGRDIAEAYLEVLNRKGHSSITLEMLDEKKKKEDQKKTEKMQKQLERLKASKEKSSKRIIQANSGKNRVETVETKLLDVPVRDIQFNFQNADEVLESDCVRISQATGPIKVTWSNAEIVSENDSNVNFSKITHQIKNAKQRKKFNSSNICGQFIIDENGHLSHTSNNIDEKALKNNDKNQFTCVESFEHFNSIDYPNMVVISQEGLDKKRKSHEIYNQMFNEKSHISESNNNLRDTFQESYENTIYSVSKEELSSSIHLASRVLKNDKNSASSNPHSNQKGTGSKQLKNLEDFGLLNDGTQPFLILNKIKDSMYNKKLSPVGKSCDVKNVVKTNSDTSIAAVEVYDLAQIKQHSIQNENDGRLDHLYYNFKILPSGAEENLPAGGIQNEDIALAQVNSSSPNCVVFDADESSVGKSHSIYSKNTIHLYLSDCSNFVPDGYILKTEELAKPVDDMSGMRTFESSEFLCEESGNIESELCYQLLKLSSVNMAKSSQGSTPSKLQLNIQMEDNTLVDKSDNIKELENITITNKINSRECSNEEFHVVSIAEVEETDSSKVTFHIVDDG